ncbi:TPA: hypothetical protein DDZ10_03295 [Candidatus Uhrbacteria bacterium]|nr:hypothetical protein [Candidatus Uhrbacteria bacterium]
MSDQQDFFSGPPQTMFAFGLVAGIAIAAIVGLFFFGGISSGSGSASELAVIPTTTQPSVAAQPTPSATLPKVTDEDWVRGDLKKAKVVLVEYSDFECPFCGSHHPTMQQLMTEYGDRVAWVYRHFPLSFHPQATPAALASECVGEQGGDAAFWRFADAMFADQGALGTARYEETVQDLGLDLAKYQDCVSSRKYSANITSDQSGGQAAGVSGTPATYVNGQLVSGAVPYAQLQAIVEAAL